MNTDAEVKLISEPMTRKQVGELFGVKGKAPTQRIKDHMVRGGLIRQFVFTEPSVSRKRELRYNITARARDLFGDPS